MFRYRWLALILIPPLAAMVALARLSGREAPSPFAAWLVDAEGRPCPKPCLLGLMPGETDYEDAVRLLRTHPVLVSLGTVQDSPSHNMSRFWTPNLEIQIGRRNNATRLDYILIYNVNFDAQTPPFNTTRLGALLALYGPPDRVDAGDNILADYYFDAHHMQVSALRRRPADDEPMRLDDIVYTLILRDAASYQVALVNAGPSVKPWRGLTLAGRYRDVKDPILVP